MKMQKQYIKKYFIYPWLFARVDFSYKKTVMRSFRVFSIVSLNKLLNVALSLIWNVLILTCRHFNISMKYIGKIAMFN